jgi:hypothetical protein
VNFVLGWQPMRATEDGANGATDGDECSEGTSLIEGVLNRDAVVAKESSSAMGQLARSCTNPMLVASVASVLLSLIGRTLTRVNPLYNRVSDICSLLSLD